MRVDPHPKPEARNPKHRHLVLFGNQLEGPIPESLSSLPSLEVLALSDNLLGGSIPERQALSSLSLLLSSLELSDTQVYEPYIRALLGKASNF